MKRSILLLLSFSALFAVPSAAQRCPSLEEFRRYRPPEATRVFASDGSRVADLSPERRVVVALDEVPLLVRDGFVAVEDRRFFQHKGVDLRGTARALWRNLMSRSMAEGFSTITMQLARSVFAHELKGAGRLRRKACEVRLALQIEQALGKQEILRLYLNQVYMGDGLYGVEEAARAYFGKRIGEVTLPEAALLIGLVKNPEGYNPRRDPARAVERRNVVLDVLARERKVSAAQAATAKRAPIRLAPAIEAAGSAPWVVAAVRAELRTRYGEDADTRGLRVHTGIVPELQSAAERILLAQLGRIEAGEFGRYRHAVPAQPLAPASGNGSPYLQGMVIVLDARTGAIRALVGGRDFVHSSYDRALAARRQPGSAFKPVVYAAAIEQGLSLAERIATTPVEIDGGVAGLWRPDDLVPDSVRSLSVRDALALSSNSAAVRVGERAGVEAVVALAKRLGLSAPIPAYPSVFLGAAEVNPAEFVAAFATFANGGFSARPRLIERIEDARGTLLWRADTARERALDEGVAFLTLSAMRDVVDRGTATVIRRRGFGGPAAGKTGTTNDGRDAWFIGVTPDFAAGVWIGFDEPRPIVAGATGGRLAAPVWADLMEVAYRDRAAPEPWATPPGVSVVAVDTESGERATSRCPADQVRDEFFLADREPAGYCTLHPVSGLERALQSLFRKLRSIF